MRNFIVAASILARLCDVGTQHLKMHAPAINGITKMALMQGEFRSYDFDRMVVLFTMMNDQNSISCAISTDAMDHLEGSGRTPPAQREQQFMRLREQIEERAIRKFQDSELEGTPPGVILRKIDFRK